MFPYISRWLWGSTSVQDTQQPATAETRQDSEAEEFVVKCEEEEEEEEEEEDEWLLVEGEPDSMGKQGPLFPNVVPNLSSTILSFSQWHHFSSSSQWWWCPTPTRSSCGHSSSGC